MSHFPPPGPPPPGPPHYGYPPGQAYTYVPTPVVMPVPLSVYPPRPHPPLTEAAQPTYVTNHIYPSLPQPQPQPQPIYQPPPQPQPIYQPPLQPQPIHQPPPQPVKVEEINWVPATPATVSPLADRAFIAGKEGWDGSPLCVIRAHHSGEFIPGKLAIKHRAAYIPHGGREISVHNFEILCAPEYAVRWLSASNGNVPVGAIAAGNSHRAEPLYIARVKHLRSVTPGKVHPSHGCCYISFGGKEISYKNYEVLCKIVG